MRSPGPPPVRARPQPTSGRRRPQVDEPGPVQGRGRSSGARSTPTGSCPRPRLTDLGPRVARIAVGPIGDRGGSGPHAGLHPARRRMRLPRGPELGETTLAAGPLRARRRHRGSRRHLGSRVAHPPEPGRAGGSVDGPAHATRKDGPLGRGPASPARARSDGGRPSATHRGHAEPGGSATSRPRVPRETGRTGRPARPRPVRARRLVLARSTVRLPSVPAPGRKRQGAGRPMRVDSSERTRVPRETTSDSIPLAYGTTDPYRCRTRRSSPRPHAGPGSRDRPASTHLSHDRLRGAPRGRAGPSRPVTAHRYGRPHPAPEDPRAPRRAPAPRPPPGTGPPRLASTPRPHDGPTPSHTPFRSRPPAHERTVLRCSWRNPFPCHSWTCGPAAQDSRSMSGGGCERAQRARTGAAGADASSAAR